MQKYTNEGGLGLLQEEEGEIQQSHYDTIFILIFSEGGSKNDDIAVTYLIIDIFQSQG